MAGRFIIGLAIGVSSLAVPLYLSEVSPAKVRGAIVTMNQLLIATGTKLSDIVAYFILLQMMPTRFAGDGCCWLGSSLRQYSLPVCFSCPKRRAG
jgi:MFS family permease